MKELLDKFKAEIVNRSQEIDSNHSLDWFSIAIGWALANGLSRNEAWTFASLERYGTPAEALRAHLQQLCSEDII